MDKISNVVLLAAIAALVVLAVVLLALLVREKKKKRQALRELEVQKGRVLARKQKIMELRGQLRSLRDRLQTSEGKLLGSFTQEEIVTGYDQIAEALRGVLQAAEAAEHGAAGRGKVKKAAAVLAESVKTAFHVTEDMQLEKPREEESEGAPAGIRGRVLVVDDNELNRELCVELMEVSGFLVDQAENGEEAVEKFRKSREGYYDVILMDVIMPVKNGYEACREIRKLFRADSERVPIIAVTANSFAEDYVQLQDAGMNDRIVKPVNQDTLLAMVNKWLRHDQEGEELLHDAGSWNSLLGQSNGEDE